MIEASALCCVRRRFHSLCAQVRTYNVLLKTWGVNYTHHTMTHPAGITKHDDVLYVLCQDQRALISFDAQGQYIADVVAEFKDDPEQMIMSPC